MMKKSDEIQIKSILQTLSQVSYTALIEVHRLKDELDPAKEQELNSYKEILEERIEKLFTEAS